MKTLKKNNKGFSLVELIVVILIMAIIAVALAPQVMKWVGESKISADNSNRATIKSSVDAAVADYMHQNKTAKIPAGEDTYTISKDSLAPETGSAFSSTTKPTDTTTLAYYIAQTMNNQYPGVEQDSTKSFKVTITETGAVTVTIPGLSGYEY